MELFKKKSNKAGAGAPPKELTDLWKLFEAGKNHNNLRGLQDRTERAYRFYEGDQWHGLGVDNPDRLPVLNFIEPTIKHKLATICMNETAVVFEGEDKDTCSFITEMVNDIAGKINLDRAHWEEMKAALITGNGYIFFPKGSICKQGAKIRSERKAWQIIDTACIFFGDEKTADIQSQPYIIIYERRPVDAVRKEAKANGIPEEEIRSIICDKDEEMITTTDVKEEVATEDGNCACLLYMTLKDGRLHIARSTRHVIYEPEHPVAGDQGSVAMDMYPLVGLVCGQKKGSSRGRGEVIPMITNQIEYNKNLYRMVVSSKNSAFPKVVYNANAVDNPEELDAVGGKISLNTDVGEVSKAVGYMQPQGMSGDAQVIGSLLMEKTRELMNAGQAVTGEINPEKASGTAIIAMRDQAAIPLNELQAASKDWWRDVAMVLLHYIIAYNPQGLKGKGDGINKDDVTYTAAQLHELDLTADVEVTDVAPYSVFARDSALEKLFTSKAITFEEYVEALDATSGVPKKKLQDILRRRGEQQAAAEVEDAIKGVNDKTATDAVEAELAAKEIEQYLPPSEESAEAEIVDVLSGGGEMNG